ncbi:hypothetical protein R4I97_03810 [Brachyspira pilosicoli]|uniref:hypothetical protein n=1 Tax=Brachyspira pilosicoli TaxID=52584 RepID=UPI00300658B8
MKKLFIFILSMILISCGSDEYVELVKSGAFNSYPNINIETLLETVFDNIEWESFIAEEDNKRYVECVGQYYDENMEEWYDVLMQFKITGDDSFSLYYIELDGESLSVKQSVKDIVQIYESIANH